MLEWAGDNTVILAWIAGASIAMFVATLFIAPIVVLRIPPDYFAHKRRPPRPNHRRVIARVGIAIAKNALGYLCIAAGLAMLFLPGQGLLTILVGLFLVDFPGKYRAVRWFISRRRVLKAINTFRRRRGREPLRTTPARGV